MGMTKLHRLIPLCCLLALALSALGCGGTAGGTNTPAALGGASDAAAPESTGAPAPADSGLPGASGNGAPAAADVVVPDAAEIAALPTPDGVDSDVWATLTAELNRVLAQYRDHPDDRGRSGGGPAAGFVGVKAISSPPTGDAGVVELSYYEPTSTLRWLYVSLGDYDQNGIVGVSDLTPLGVHFGEESPDGAGQPFPPESLGAAIDGNSDGLIGVGDITPIGQYFGAQVAGYHVYFSDDPNDYPLDPAADNGSGTVLSDLVDFSAALGDTGERKRFEYVLPEDAALGLYWVRATDGSNDGAASNAVSVGLANLAPIAVLGATPLTGLAPLTVQFNALGSGDLDGTIAKYEWDWNGEVDGEEWEDTDMLGVVTHVYAEPGTYLPVLRVTDDGGATATDEMLIKAKAPSPPVASLDASPSSGPAPLAVEYNANASGDFDGFITKYQWDFDDSGEYAYDSGLESTTTFHYQEPGTYTASVRVTDDDGLTGAVSVEVTVEDGAEWHDVYVPSMDRPQFCTALLDVAGRPAIAYDTRTQDPNQGWLKYVRAADSLGEDWADPLTIEDFFNSPNSLVMAIVDGRPAIVKSWPAGGLVTFTRAEDSEGSAWPASPASCTIYAGNSQTSLAILGGLPALCRGKLFVQALDLDGAAWNEPVVFPSGSLNQDDANPTLCVVGDRPAISYYGNGRLLYVRADDAEGQSWGVSIAVDDQDSAKGASRLLVVDGRPAIAYHDATLGALKYARALDALGSNWETGRVLAPRGVPAGLILLDDRPAILYRDTADKGLRCLIANDSAGASWSFPQLVTAIETRDTSPSFAQVDGGPAASFLEDGDIHWLHYAAYY